MTKKKKKTLWTQCFLHLRLKNYKITYSLKTFQKYQESDLISFKFLVSILLNFQWKKYSLFKNSYTIGLNITKPPKCPLNSLRAFQQYKFETTYTIQYWKATQNQRGLRFPKYICKFTLYALIEKLCFPPNHDSHFFKCCNIHVYGHICVNSYCGFLRLQLLLFLLCSLQLTWPPLGTWIGIGNWCLQALHSTLIIKISTCMLFNKGRSFQMVSLFILSNISPCRNFLQYELTMYEDKSLKAPWFEWF
jgi:hypothetical protein